MSLKWIDVDCYDCFAVLMTYLKYEHWITLVYPNFLRHSVVCGWPHWNGMSVACPTGLVVWNRFWIRASQGSCLTTSLSPLSSPPWNSFMIGVRPIDDPFVTVYFDRWHRHHLVQALCDSMRELTVGVLSGWAKLNLGMLIPSDGRRTINFHQLPLTSINFRQPQSSRSCLSLGIWFAKAQLRGIFHNLKHEDSLKTGRHSQAPSRWRIGMNWSNMMHIDALTGI